MVEENRNKIQDTQIKVCKVGSGVMMTWHEARIQPEERGVKPKLGQASVRVCVHVKACFIYVLHIFKKKTPCKHRK